MSRTFRCWRGRNRFNIRIWVKGTQDWTEHHVVFNSLDNSEVNVYLGVWGGGKGNCSGKIGRLRRWGC